jgi:hypothetical protein
MALRQNPTYAKYFRMMNVGTYHAVVVWCDSLSTNITFHSQ